MDNKTLQLIMDAAEAFADKIDDGTRTPRQCAIKAYIEVATAPLRQWHDIPGEEPQKAGSCIILLTGKKHKFLQFSFRGSEDWQKLVKQNNAVRWAYKDELL